jgi:hypothetical protein
MTSSASLLGEVFDITRGDLEDAQFPFVPPDVHFRGFTSLRVTRLSEFWKGDHRSGTGTLLQSTESLIRGFYGQRCAWTFALCGRHAEIQCWFGTASDEVDGTSLDSLIRTHFPDARISGERFDVDFAAGLKSGAIVTGTPSAKSRAMDPVSRDQLGQLCRAMFGTNWIYIVSARPVPHVETVRRINEIADRIRDARATFLLRTSPIDDENRTGKRYVDLLESKLRRLEQGRISGMWDVRCACYCETDRIADRARQVLESVYSGEESVPDPVRVRPFSASLSSAPLLEPLTTAEAAALAQMPREEFPGLELVEAARFGVEPGSTPKDALRIGEIIDRGTNTGNWLRLSRSDLTKHALVVGTTGSGKTNSCQWLLDQVWDNGSGVPFLVIESAKSEYRQLLLNPRFMGVRLFTIGDETVAPLRLNPFEVPAAILIQTHIDYLKSLFAAAFVLYPPMPYVLEQAVQEIYEDRGWDIARNANSRGVDSPRCAPTLDDLAAKIPVVVERMGYDQRISMDVKAGLVARVNQLRLAGGKGLMLNTRRSLDHAVLFERPCVLELKQLVSDDEKAFVIGLLLIRLYEYHEARRARHSGLVHLTLIEEAHRLLRNVSMEQGSEVSPNPRGRAVEVFANILSEIRAFGEGIVVAEQIPTKLTPDVLKNTGVKLIHRLVSPDDRMLLGRAVNLSDAQVRRVATLATGEAVAWTEHTAKAVLVRVPAAEDGRAALVSDEVVRSRSQLHGSPSLLPFDSCQGCPGSVSGVCGSLPRDQWTQPLLLAFRRAFNALRQYPSAIVPAFAEFHHLVHRDSRSASRAVCTFAALADREIERRGEFKAWPFTAIDGLIASLGDISRLVLGAMDQGVTPVVPDELLSVFQARSAELHRVGARPYPGCRHCDAPCSFRFDMAHVDAKISNDFQQTYLNVRIPTHRLATIARAAATRSFFVSDQASCSGAAFCFAVQELASPTLGVATYHQFRMATVLKEQLAQRERGTRD